MKIQKDFHQMRILNLKNIRKIEFNYTEELIKIFTKDNVEKIENYNLRT